MPVAASAVPPHLELLTFLSDQNAQVRQVALSNLVGYSAKTNPRRTLLIDKHLGTDGKPLKGRDGNDVDTIQDLKRLCQDQPMTAHNALCALINLSDSLLVARRIGDAEFLSFLVQYIADPVSLLTDLACMLLSNLTKLESVGATLLSLQVPTKPLYSFMSSQDAKATMEAMSVEPDDPDFDSKKRRAEQHAERLRSLAEQGEQQAPALQLLLDAFEEGADVAGGKSQAATIDEMRNRAREIQQEGASPEEAPLGPDGRPIVKRKSNCSFLASVFANVTTIPKGREYFVSHSATEEQAASSDAKEYPVSRITPYTEHPDLIRRGGVISTLKNILFIKSAHQLLLAPPPTDEKNLDDMLAGAPRSVMQRTASTIDVLPHLLLPLCDGRELAKLDMEDQEALPDECQLIDEDKRRESDPALRLMLVDSLLLLCTTLYGRQCLRARGAYIVVREAHLEENDEKVAEAVVRLVNILKRDESQNSIDNTQEEIGAETNASDEESDEDLVIEEL